MKYKIDIASNGTFFNLADTEIKTKSKQTKLWLKNTFVGPDVTYGAESWTLTAEYLRALSILYFWMENLCRISGPVK